MAKVRVERYFNLLFSVKNSQGQSIELGKVSFVSPCLGRGNDNWIAKLHNIYDKNYIFLGNDGL